MKEDCGCCEGIGIATPVSECNPPGLSAIAYRAGTYATFLETMLARLSNLSIEIPSVAGTGTDILYPLKQLTARDTSDPAIALLDAWAVVGDVLTFYQERIANEGYLPTAIERRSVLELARLVGYRLRPGVAASVYLAFTTATGFRGQLPAGTRAQSIPGPGELPQFFETSDPLDARDVWNAMKPRLTRPQFITLPDTTADAIPAVTDASVIDTVYLDDISTNLKTGDAMLFVFGTDSGQQWLRAVERIDVQAEAKRTEVALVPSTDFLGAAQSLQLFIDKASYLFPGSVLAQNVATILKALQNNLVVKGLKFDEAMGFVRLAISQLREQEALARGRKFSRVAVWIFHIVELLPGLAAALSDQQSKTLTAVAMPSALEASPLRSLLTLTSRLTIPRSVQPANAALLKRSVARSFAPQSDIAPRLLAALKPTAATSLYPAWRGIPNPGYGVDVFAMRAKALLFASRYTGPATPHGGDSVPTYNGAPTINTAWPEMKKSTNSIPPTVLLDSPYDQIKPGSWVVIDRPMIGIFSRRAVTFHMVTATRAGSQDSGTGYAANVTALTLEPQWLQDVLRGDTGEKIGDVLGSNDVLRGTLVHVQAEALALTEEPLDTDVALDTVGLDAVYDGLEPGRWVIVSGARTDIPNVSGVMASELAMIAAVAQGTEASLCVPFPAGFIPFSEIKYTTPANAQGDRLVVGIPNPSFLDMLNSLPDLQLRNQEYCQQVELAPGFFANAYVPTAAEREGDFSAFQGLLTDPDTNVPVPGGHIHADMQEGPYGGDEPPKFFAWRISQKKLHTSLKLAAPLAYTYDMATVCVYGNVAKATHGQTVGEVLGDGDASQSFQTLALRQSPLTYISAPTPSGASSTLSVTVNELEWHERDDLTEEGPKDRTFVTSASDEDKVSVVFGNGMHGARPPTGTANIKATYRYGIGAAGNVAAGKISQLATHPLGAQGVINPLPASGGADRDSADEARRNAPMAVMALDRLVSVKDYADFSRTYAGIGKATAARMSDGHKQVVHVTIAGAHDIPIDANSDLYNNLLQSLLTYGDPHLPVQIGLRKIKLLVTSARVRMLPDCQWEDVEPRLRAAMLGQFGFDARDLGQSAFVSEAVRTMQEVDGVSSVEVQIFDSVGEDVTAETLASLAGTLTLYPAVAAELAKRDPNATDPGQRILPAELVFLTPDIPDMLILTNIGA
jgi:hypothetical protein